MPYIQQGPQSCHRNCYFLLIFPHLNSPEVWKAAKGMPVIHTMVACPIEISNDTDSLLMTLTPDSKLLSAQVLQLFTFESIRHLCYVKN